ncbi:MAG: helix-turn-helix transcriptional regulator [Bacteroidales bacterium]|nr:helix-turn-helix transcriptional regulator [Bacteroidales bacterium]
MDLIKDRIAHIIRAKNLTATQFAEMMQIQPSNVSHLLSGRNKPSLDFLIKLKDLFPEYSFDWIILGKKPITVSEHFQPHRDIIMEPDENPKLFDDNIFINKESQRSEDNRVIDNVVMDNIVDNDKVISKNIKQIVLVYDDNTFEILDKR